MSSPDGARSPDDADGDVVRVEWDAVDRPSTDIVRAIATATGRDPTERPLLYDTVDGGAVGSLLGGEDTDGLRLSVTYAGTSVVVDRGESIEGRRVTA